MKISKNTSRKEQSYLNLDENNEIKEVKGIEYTILLQSKEEHENIQNTIIDAILQEIEVYETTSQLGKLEHHCNQVFLNHETVIVLTTNDENKFDVLEKIVKEIMLKNKKFLH